jgi:HPr kinase/phosphorylase
MATVHASAVLVGARAVLIRGPSGSGKSRLALELIHTAQSGLLRFARLVGDDRVQLQTASGRLLVRPADALAGLLEIRGLGVVQLKYESAAVVGLVVDLSDAASERMPDPRQRQITIDGVTLPRLAVALGHAALPALLAVINSPGRWLDAASNPARFAGAFQS